MINDLQTWYAKYTTILFSLFFSGGHSSNQRVNHGVLSRPVFIVQKRSQIKSIIIRRIRLRMITGRKGGHFMSIDRIVVEKPLHFRSNLRRRQCRPLVNQFHKHRYRSAPICFSKTAKHTQLIVGHPHLVLVFLGLVFRCPLSNGTQLGRGRCLHNLSKYRKSTLVR